jgi:hypothetical protein
MIPITDFSVVVLPAPYVEIDAVKDVGLAVPGFEILHRQYRRRGAGLRGGGIGHLQISHDQPPDTLP